MHTKATIGLSAITIAALLSGCTAGAPKPAFISHIVFVDLKDAGDIPELIADCDATLSLPMPGGTESLNASIAGAIAMYTLRDSE